MIRHRWRVSSLKCVHFTSQIYWYPMFWVQVQRYEDVLSGMLFIVSCILSSIVRHRWRVSSLDCSYAFTLHRRFIEIPCFEFKFSGMMTCWVERCSLYQVYYLQQWDTDGVFLRIFIFLSKHHLLYVQLVVPFSRSLVLAFLVRRILYNVWECLCIDVSWCHRHLTLVKRWKRVGWAWSRGAST